MLKELFVYYSPDLPESIKSKFDEDFVEADRTILKFVCAYGFIVAFITSLQYGYYLLGIIGGGLICALSFAAYKTMAGTVMSRVILTTALTAMMAISIQQANGLGEGHFIFFINFAIVIRYLDVVPLITLVGLTVLHHLTLTYCQYVGVTLGETPLMVFSWGPGLELGLFEPLLYHVLFAVFAAIVALSYIRQGNIKFIESNTLIGSITKAADGDMTVRAEAHVESELIKKINQFYQRLNQFFRQTAETASRVQDQSVSEANAAKMRSTKATEQGHSIDFVVESLTEMTQVTQDIANNAESTATSIRSTLDTSEQGRELARSFQSTIESLSSKVELARENISELEQNSGQIHSIIATIKGISEQTNLLALNAAIEAARAGEQGRGFAVVADEVRNLSQRTHTSTEEISRMIDALQNTTGSAVSAMDECSQLTSGSVDDVRQVASSFEHIAADMQQISNMASQIATAAEQQTVSTEGIAKNTSDAQLVSKEFVQQARDNQVQVEALAKLAKDLNQSLQQFRY